MLTVASPSWIIQKPAPPRPSSTATSPSVKVRSDIRSIRRLSSLRPTPANIGTFARTSTGSAIEGDSMRALDGFANRLPDEQGRLPWRDEALGAVGAERRARLVEVESTEEVAMEVTIGAAATALPPRPALAPGEADRVGDLPRWPLEVDHSPAFRVFSITRPIMPP